MGLHCHLFLGAGEAVWEISLGWGCFGSSVAVAGPVPITLALLGSAGKGQAPGWL